MARMSFEEGMKYINSSAGFFMLQDDGDTEDIKILLDSLSDVELFSVHIVRYNGKWVKIPCFKNAFGDPDSVCPLCSCNKEKERVNYKKFFIPIYNISNDVFQYWERGVSFRRTLVTLCEKYYPLRDEVFQIERVGAKGDPKTTYNITAVTEEYLEGNDLDEINEKISNEEIPDAFSEEAGLVILKSKEEVEYYLKNGRFEDDAFEYADLKSGNRDFRGGSRFDHRSSRGYSSRNSSNEEEEDNSYTRRANRRREF